jgi:hypothetical protein
VTDLTTRLLAIKPGGVVVYHVGDLATDRASFGARGVLIDDVANIAWTLHQTGRVHLVQRRLQGVTGRVYEYLAIAKMPRLHEQSGLGPRSYHSGMAKLR